MDIFELYKQIGALQHLHFSSQMSLIRDTSYFIFDKIIIILPPIWSSLSGAKVFREIYIIILYIHHETFIRQSLCTMFLQHTNFNKRRNDRLFAYIQCHMLSYNAMLFVLENLR